MRTNVTLPLLINIPDPQHACTNAQRSSNQRFQVIVSFHAALWFTENDLEITLVSCPLVQSYQDIRSDMASSPMQKVKIGVGLIREES